jgi:hypothetical protein
MPAGLNQFLAVPVPPGNGDGALLDVSTTVAEKTFYLSGDFRGLYTILGTHDDVLFVPILFFTAGQGPRTIRRDIVATLKTIFVRRAAIGNVVINMGSQTVCVC